MIRSGGRLRWLAMVVGAVLLAGCPEEDEGERETESARPSSAARPEPAPPPEREAAGPSSPAGWRIVGDGDQRRREPLERGAELAPDGAASRVDLPAGGRFVVAQGAQARLGEVAPAQLILGSGAAGAQAPATGPRNRPEVRLASPSVTVVLPQGGHVWVAALPDGRSRVAALQGHVELVTGEVESGDDGDGKGARLRRLRLDPGQAVWVEPDGVGEPGPGPERLEAAREQARALLREAGEPEPTPHLESWRQRAERALEAVEGERARGRALSAAHRQAVEEGPERARKVRGELVRHGQRLLRGRGRLLAAWERVAALALAAGRSEAVAPLGERVDRAMTGQP